MCFLVFGIETRREVGLREKLSKISFFFFWSERCLGLFIATGTFFEATALGGPRP